MPHLAIVNDSTVLGDEQAQAFAAVLQKQIDRDWQPAWASRVDVSFLPKTDKPAPLDWVLAFLDDSDQADALGYHWTSDTGMPLGKSFVRTDQQHGLSWSVTASHEALEMLGDPSAMLNALVQTDATNAVLYPLEVCDPVEDDQFGYLIDGMRMSDFVYPAYWQGVRVAGQRFDHMAALDQPVPHMLTGGYLSMLKLADGSWQQVYGQKSEKDRGRLERGFHRRKLRQVPMHHRRPSQRFKALKAQERPSTI